MVRHLNLDFCLIKTLSFFAILDPSIFPKKKKKKIKSIRLVGLRLSKVLKKFYLKVLKIIYLYFKINGLDFIRGSTF